MKGRSAGAVPRVGIRAGRQKGGHRGRDKGVVPLQPLHQRVKGRVAVPVARGCLRAQAQTALERGDRSNAEQAGVRPVTHEGKDSPSPSFTSWPPCPQLAQLGGKARPPVPHGQFQRGQVQGAPRLDVRAGANQGGDHGRIAAGRFLVRHMDVFPPRTFTDPPTHPVTDVFRVGRHLPWNHQVQGRVTLRGAQFGIGATPQQGIHLDRALSRDGPVEGCFAFAVAGVDVGSRL